MYSIDVNQLIKIMHSIDVNQLIKIKIEIQLFWLSYSIREINQYIYIRKMRSSLLFLCIVVALLQTTLVKSGGDVTTQDDCECNEESSNGQYCKKWICKVNQKCFPGSSSVTVLNDGGEKIIPVTQLKIGDCVIDSFEPRNCSKVNAISYREHNAESYFAEIISENITAFATFEHLIPTLKGDNLISRNNMVFKQIKDLEIGDIIITKYGQFPVREIQYNKSKGVYSPHTDSGLIVVDDVLFSTYSSITYHSVAHWFFSWYNGYRSQYSDTDDVVPSTSENMLISIALKLF
jgi:hypothetical protein